MSTIAILLALGLCGYLVVIDHRLQLLPGWATTGIGVLGVVEAAGNLERHVTVLLTLAVLLILIIGWAVRVRARHVKRPPFHGGDTALLVAVAAWLSPMNLSMMLLATVPSALLYRRLYFPGRSRIPLGPPIIIATITSKALFLGFDL